MEQKETKTFKRWIGWACSLLFGGAVLLFFGLVYPHHLHYQEQFQLFLLDSAYVWDVVKLPGGVADLLGRFCTQFFLYAWVGALIIAVLLSAVQLLMSRLVNSQFSIPRSALPLCSAKNSQFLYGLSFVPSFLLWLFLLDENALLGGVWAVLLTLLVDWLFSYIRFGWVRHIVLIVTVPILYWMVGPVCVVFFLLQIMEAFLQVDKQHAQASNESALINSGIIKTLPVTLFVVLAFMPILLSYYLPVPMEKLWFGVHYYRYPTAFPTLLWTAALSVVVLAVIVGVANYWGNRHTKREPSESSRFSFLLSPVSFLLIAIVMGILVWRNTNIKAEKVMQYDFMACHQQWNRILETINVKKPNNQIGVTVQNLALAMRGMLLNQMFNYNQNGIAGLLPDVKEDATSPLPTAEAFYHLGMINVAQRTVFEAQEAILDFQKSGRCYKRLAQTNLINGNYEVARKYLVALQKTLFYREWANETLSLLGDEEAIANHPEYGRLRKMAYKDDFYFSDHVTSEMLQNLYFVNTDNRLAYQYLIAYYVLTGDREGLNQFMSIKR